jgi:hypothetical protein
MTAGGFFYSMRVLSPALVLSSIAAGGFFAAVLHKNVKYGAACMIVCLIACAAGFVQDFTIPLQIWNRPVSGSVKIFLAKGSYLPFMDCAKKTVQYFEDGTDVRILGDNSYFHSAFSGGNIEMVPIWSPEVAFLFEDSVPFEGKLEHLAQKNIKYYLCSPQFANKEYLGKFDFFRQVPSRYEAVIEEGDGIIYDLGKLEAGSASDPNPKSEYRNSNQ